VTRYYENQVYDELDKLYPDMKARFARYRELQLLSPGEASKYKKIYLDGYYRKQEELYKESDRKILETAPNIPVPMPYTIRPEYKMSGIQQDIRTAATEVPGPTWADWQKVLSPSLQKAIVEAASSGGDLKYSAMNQLKEVAEKKFDMSGYAAWRQIQLLLKEE